ncbi:unnamed protein product [marine sediment metagenome]|uniref:Uncharacterized protein n=1 Tax=marine sediment metagenome TaxID=412755 RepID=X0Z021_9ZZZZ
MKNITRPQSANTCPVPGLDEYRREAWANLNPWVGIAEYV